MRTLSFDAFTLGNELRRDGKTIHLKPKPRAVLHCLLKHAGERVAIDAIRAWAWGDVSVAPACVHTAVSTLRRALDGHVTIFGGGGGYLIHTTVTTDGAPGTAGAWRYYAARATGTAEERIATADALMQAEVDRYGA